MNCICNTSIVYTNTILEIIQIKKKNVLNAFLISTSIHNWNLFNESLVEFLVKIVQISNLKSEIS